MRTEIRIRDDEGGIYEWEGTYGAVLSSYERGVRPGDCRVIFAVPMYAYSVTTCLGYRGPFFRKRPRVGWVPVQDHASGYNEWIVKFRSYLFCSGVRP